MPVVILLCFVLSLGAQETFDVYLLGGSKHQAWSGPGSPQEFNPGLGLGYTTDSNISLLGLTYKDSYGKRAYLIGAGPSYTLGDLRSFHGTTKLILGKLHGSDYNGPIAIPTVGLGYSYVTIEGTYSPKDEVICYWATLRFPIH